ncbi:cache domain-containing protein [Burkholderia sp. 22PA0106]|uniref:cache domain-containing protein n=1 Tax=Burkholderia sp. 22PA0106 TaxID=3237371 RepID=UPI0039C4C0C5
MKLKAKILLLAIVPFLAAIAAIGFGVRQQATSLARAQHETIESAYLASKELELKHYVELATSAIAPLYAASRDGAAGEDTRRAQALEILRKMDFGPDGYFFVYDLQGNSLMHPREPERVGRNFWAMRDALGAPTIQQLVEAASHGGGYVRYQWQRPSTGRIEGKLGYVVALERWGWMLGTGIYLDDVDRALANIDARASAEIDSTMKGLAAIALAGAAVIALCALVLNVSESRHADARLKALAQRVVESQEDERARLSRELHDGISQMMVSVKLMLESVLERLERGPARDASAEGALAKSAARLGDVLREVRRISHALRPAMLDDLGLAAALDQLIRELQGQGESGVEIGYTQVAHSGAPPLPAAVNTALFRIAQEALTNLLRHAQATRGAVSLDIGAHSVALSVADNGRGFDVERTQADPHRGVGLRNMRERIAALGGILTIRSQPGHTVISARVPLRAAAPAAARPTDTESR